MRKIGKSVIVKNKEQYDEMKNYLGTKSMYLDWVPQMGKIETAVVIEANKNSDFSIGSVGRASYQESCGLKLITFEEYTND